MCHQNNNIVNDKKCQPLTEIEMGKIEAKLDEGLNASEIARYLKRDDSGIRREIRNFSITKMPGSKFIKKCSNCSNNKECSSKNLCNTKVCKDKSCKGCLVAPPVCKKYVPIVSCKYLRGHKKVCNGCKKKKHCIKPKKVYMATASAEQHKKNKRNSVKKEKGLGHEEYLNDIAKRIKQGQSPQVAINTLNKEYEITISVPTVYSYIDKQIIPCSNIDLRNKLKRKVKNERRIYRDKRKHRSNGRSYNDLKEEAKGKKEYGNMQMDVVEGSKGGKVLLTLLEKSTSFLFAIPMDNKKQMDVINQINNIERNLGNEFKYMFKTLLTDNGSEFLDYEGIEQGITGEKRTSIYYADPYASYQKGSIENQHRLIRYFFPKGKDFSEYSDELIKAQINKINNYPRKELGWKTPYQMLCKKISADLLKKLGFYYIPIEKLDMKTKKIA